MSMKTSLTISQQQFILENYSNMGLTACQKQLNISKYPIINFAREHHLKMNRSEHNKLISNANKNKPKLYARKTVDISPLKKLDNPWVAYILGLIWADGHVSNGKIQIKIMKKDMDEIKDGLKFLFDFSFFEVKKLKDRWQDVINAYFNSVEATDYLKILGFFDKSIKSPDLILSKLSNQLQLLFLRGIMDGDGSVSYRKNGLLVYATSHFEQDWSYLEKFCESNKIEFKIYRVSSLNKKTGKQNSRSVFRLSGYGNNIRFCKLVWESFEKDSIGISRKYSVFKNYIENTKYKKIKSY